MFVLRSCIHFDVICHRNEFFNLSILFQECVLKDFSISEKMVVLNLTITGMTCGKCERIITEGVTEEVTGVTEVKIDR